MKQLLCVALIALSPLAAAAAPAASAPTAARAAETAVIQVNGLVCDFCAQSLEKVLGRKPEVARVTVDMDAQQVRIAFRAGRSLPDGELRRLITNAGFATVSITRSAA